MTHPITPWLAAAAGWTEGPLPVWLVGQAAEEAHNIEEATERAREQTTAQLLPALATLDKLGSELEKDTAGGSQPPPATTAAYRLQADHARHLLQASGLDAAEIRDAEREHRDAGPKGYAARALDHIHHPRDVDTLTQQTEQNHERERNEEQEVEL